MLILVSLHSLRDILNDSFSEIPRSELSVSAEQVASRIILSPQEKLWMESHKAIRARVADYPPYHMWDNQAYGISVDYLNLACEAYKIKCHYVTGIPWTEAIDRLQYGDDFDVLLTIVRTHEREERLLFTQNYLEQPLVIFTSVDSPFLSDISELKGKKISIEKGFVLQSLISEQYPEISQYLVGGSKEALDALSGGVVEAYIGNLTVGSYLINRYGYSNIKVAAPTPFGGHILSMAVRESAPELASLLDKFLTALTPREKAEITNRWLSIRFDQRVGWEFIVETFLVIGSAAAVALFAFWLHHRSLVQEIKKREEAQNAANRSKAVLECLGKLRVQFIREPDPFKLFPLFITELLTLTGSEMGFVGDVLCDENGKFLKLYGLSDVSWDEESKMLYKECQSKGLEFRNLDNLLGMVITTGEPVISNDVSGDSRGSGFPNGHLKIDTFIGIPVYFGDQLVGEVGLANREGGYDESFLKWLSPVISGLGQIIVARWDREAKEAAERELLQLAMTDTLTGIPNRRAFEERIQEQIERKKRYQEESVLIMLDIDYFKAVNDNYGHKTGDQVLVDLVGLVKAAVREVDLFARWGGEEFLILMPQTGISGGATIAERIRLMVEQHSFKHLDSMTISLGVTELKANDTEHKVIGRADEALYTAKHSGRNRVVSLC